MHYTRKLLKGDVGGPQPMIGEDGSGHITPKGYRIVHVSGRRILEHRLVMERHLGRPLANGESVHHRDGNRLNNAVENLELWGSHQPSGQRVSDKVRAAVALLRAHPEILADEGFELLAFESAETSRRLINDPDFTVSDAIRAMMAC